MPEPIPLISHPDQVTPSWLTSVLTAAGAVHDAVVESVTAEPVGTGQVGDSVRFTIDYDQPDAGPPTVVGKFPAEDETSRAASVATRTYEIETRFYQHLRDRVDITTPTPYVALLDVAANEFVLLMNDLAPARQGDQLHGCTADQAALAVEEAAKLHAPVWGDTSLSHHGWLARHSEGGRAFYVQLLRMYWPAFLERYDGRVDDDVAVAGTTLIERLDTYLRHRPEPHTAAHGDFRLDNMLFGTDEGGAPLTVVDWQTVGLGPGVTDVSYFLGTSPLPHVRAANERDLVREYHSMLRAGGVRDFSFDQCWEDYRRFAFQGLLMAVGASMMVGQTDRGDEMFMAMANRSGRTALELDALAFLT